MVLPDLQLQSYIFYPGVEGKVIIKSQVFTAWCITDTVAIGSREIIHRIISSNNIDYSPAAGSRKFCSGLGNYFYTIYRVTRHSFQVIVQVAGGEIHRSAINIHG
ncbi:hypothetical protein D3C80_1657120 [compost metagenome]